MRFNIRGDGMERTIPEIGKKAPAFCLLNQDGEKTCLRDYQKKWVVVYFYPKDNTSGCTIEAIDFTSYLKDFSQMNATIVGISPDTVESHKKFIEKQKLKVTLLSDESKEVMAKYGAWGKKTLYGKIYDGVIRSTFIVDQQGNVAHAWKTVSAKGHAESVKKKLGELQK
jgi:thioredoxin-dependent peroxiredoxin